MLTSAKSKKIRLELTVRVTGTVGRQGQDQDQAVESFESTKRTLYLYLIRQSGVRRFRNSNLNFFDWPLAAGARRLLQIAHRGDLFSFRSPSISETRVRARHDWDTDPENELGDKDVALASVEEPKKIWPVKMVQHVVMKREWNVLTTQLTVI